MCIRDSDSSCSTSMLFALKGPPSGMCDITWTLALPCAPGVNSCALAGRLTASSMMTKGREDLRTERRYMGGLGDGRWLAERRLQPTIGKAAQSRPRNSRSLLLYFSCLLYTSDAA